jgi:hypothetical protein
MGNSFQWDQEHSFSIPIPSEINVQGVTSPSPPSFLAYHQDASCDIFYAVKFRMYRKGLRRQILSVFRFHGLIDRLNHFVIFRKTIPILYLPKTKPSFNRMPRSRQLRGTFLSMFDHVKTVNLTPYWHLSAKKISKSASLDCFSKSIYVSFELTAMSFFHEYLTPNIVLIASSSVFHLGRICALYAKPRVPQRASPG